METSASIEIAQHTLLSCGLILAIGTLGGFLAQKIRVPDIAVFLLAGIAIEPHVLGLIDIPADSALNQIILLFGASYILFDGGAALRLEVLKQVWVTIVVLATVGVLITAAITGLAAHIVFGIPPVIALLLGATLASTDPATLVPIFRQIRIQQRVAQTVMSESAFNDAMAAIVTFSVLGLAVGNGDFSLSAAVLDLFKQTAIGILAGLALGYLAALLIAHERWGAACGIRSGRDPGRRHRRLFRSERTASLGLHGRVRVRHRARQQGAARLSHGGGRSTEA